MSDAIHLVTSYDDLVAVDAVTERDRTHVAQLLSDGARGVVWLPEWLTEEKDLAPAYGAPQLFCGVVSEYSDQALRVSQPGGSSAFVPKSEAEAFRAADGVETIETPQTGLGSFGVKP